MILYTVLVVLAAFLAVPALLVAAAISERYRTGLGQRFGFLPPIPPSVEGRKRIWLHCASVGEVQTASSLIDRLLSDSRVDLVLSTLTPEGHRTAADRYGTRCPVVFWPVELPWVVKRTMAALRPDALLIMETELWPMVLHQARRRRLPVAVLNARISDGAFTNYRRIRFFLGPLIRSVALFSVQSEQYGRRLREMGVSAGSVHITGNLKFDLDLDRGSMCDEPCFVDGIWPAGSPVFTAASTHEGEEEAAIGAFLDARTRVPDLRMVIAPRHVKRAVAVGRLLSGRGVEFEFRTRLEPGRPLEKAVVLLDTIGELVMVLARCAVCFVGGSLVPVGGHNILEPAALGVPVLFGTHMENFREARDAIFAASGGVEVSDASDLAMQVGALLAEPERRRCMADNALEVVRQNRGAMGRTLALLEALLFSG